jgi:hypothetical protein
MLKKSVSPAPVVSIRKHRYPGPVTMPALVECAGLGCYLNLRDYAMGGAGAGQSPFSQDNQGIASPAPVG